jgi:hypothetical protein
MVEEYFQQRVYLRRSMLMQALGTQNLSSFLCHKVDRGVSRMRRGRWRGWYDNNLSIVSVTRKRT